MKLLWIAFSYRNNLELGSGSSFDLDTVPLFTNANHNVLGTHQCNMKCKIASSDEYRNDPNFLDFQNSGKSKIMNIWIYVFRTVCVEKLLIEVKNQVHARQHVFGVDQRSVRIVAAAVRLGATTKKERCARTPDTSADSFVIRVRRTNSARSGRIAYRVRQRKRKRGKTWSALE